MTIIAKLFTEYFSLARLAQSVERETLNLKVAGSTPAFGFFWFVGFVLVRVLDLIYLNSF